MKNKYHILFEIILLVIIAFLLHSEDIENEDIGSSSKIDSLNRIIDSQILITDSISSLINTRRDTIIQIKTKYEKQTENIILNTPDSDFVFFTKYIQDNFGTTEESKFDIRRER